jgi:hypothetical protein
LPVQWHIRPEFTSSLSREAKRVLGSSVAQARLLRLLVTDALPRAPFAAKRALFKACALQENGRLSWLTDRRRNTANLEAVSMQGGDDGANDGAIRFAL